MTIEAALDEALRFDPVLSPALGNRIYWIQVPQTAIVPYLVYTTISDTDQPEAFGDTNTGQARIQFDIVSDKKTDKELMYRVREILRGKNALQTWELYPSTSLFPGPSLYPHGNEINIDIRHIAPVQFRERFDAATMRYIFSIDLEFIHGY
jgi:hypothetical protein